MHPTEFIKKWQAAELKERSASQAHFLDLCKLLEVEDPISADPKGDWFTFERGASKTSGGEGWADVWRKGCFAWEYKGKKKDLDKAFDQLLQYSIALENPPLLIVSDMARFRVHTNWTNTVQQVHEFELHDLLDAKTRDLLRNCFLDPERLRPAKTRQALTEEAAKKFATLAQRLRDRGHDAGTVAHFVNRLVFCMFAEDVDLLPNKMFQRVLEHSLKVPEEFRENAELLFNAMASKTINKVGLEKVEWFNGGLFDNGDALDLETQDVEDLFEAAKLDWSEIDPSILGTLFERGLDPDKRSQLGAHYTDRDKIMQIVNPVIVDPLLAEWAKVKVGIQAALEKAQSAKSRSAQTKAEIEAERLHTAFLERLRGFRVLDPACGSGNFLYLSLLALKDIEHRTNLEAEALGLPRGFPTIGPESVKGIELNPYAAELARVSVWIGEIQWMRRNGFEAARNPILRPLDTIENRDALVEFNSDTNIWTEATWPSVDVIVGNPPFLGGKSMKSALGEESTNIIRSIYGHRLTAFSDLVCYWFEKAREMIANGNVRYCGLVSTKAIAKNANLPVLQKLAEDATIFDAWGNEPWVVNGAAVRVSIVCFAASDIAQQRFRLDGSEVDRINPNLTSGIDTSRVARLKENEGTVFIGVQQSGPLTVSHAKFESLAKAPINPNGFANTKVLARYVTTEDLVGRPSNRFLLDFPTGLSEAEASAFEAPFEYLAKESYDPFRNGKLINFPVYRKGTASQNSSWWEPHRVRPELRKALTKVKSYVATGETTEHRVFRFLPSNAVPDKSLYAFPYAGFVGFGILQSSFHEVWCTYFGNRIGAGNQRRYNASYVYLTFPFPEGLTPDISADEYSADTRAQSIAQAAAELNRLRENWLNPPDLVERVPEVVAGYPDRLLPKDDKAAKELKKRTLTNLYNARPAWLDHAHKRLDEAVAEAYGWGDDWRAGKLTDDEILGRLFRLNQERAALETKAAAPKGRKVKADAS